MGLESRRARWSESDLFFRTTATLGESPRWDAKRGAIWWVDISAGVLHRTELRTGADKTFDIGQPVSSVALTDADEVVLTLAGGVYGFGGPDWFRKLVEIEPRDPDRFPNDSFCDRSGRFWVGTLDRGFAAGKGRLFVIENGVSKLAAEDFTIPNGIGFSPDEGTMYIADSYLHCVTAFDYDARSGRISSRRTFVAVDPREGLPDGLSVDEEGGVWLGLFGGGCVRRYDPGGALTDEICLPATQVTAPCFVGADRDELVVTTARIGDARPMTDAELALQPLAGSLFKGEAGAVGLPASPCRWRGPHQEGNRT